MRPVLKLKTGSFLCAAPRADMMTKAVQHSEPILFTSTRSCRKTAGAGGGRGQGTAGGRAAGSAHVRWTGAEVIGELESTLWAVADAMSRQETPQSPVSPPAAPPTGLQAALWARHASLAAAPRAAPTPLWPVTPATPVGRPRVRHTESSGSCSRVPAGAGQHSGAANLTAGREATRQLGPAVDGHCTLP